MSAENKRLLLVGTHQDARERLAAHFGRKGYKVTVAETAKRVLEIMTPRAGQTNRSFDLVLLDISELGEDNYGMIQELKNTPFLSDIPMAVVTSSDDADGLKKCMDLGVEVAVTLKEQISKMERELEIGRQIQLDFLPKNIPQPSGWEVATHFDAALEVAGDFYDVINLPDGKIALVLGDVCDKGVGPALFMSLSRSLMRAFSEANRSTNWMKEYVDGIPTTFNVTDQERHALFASGNSALLAVEMVNDYIAYNHGDMVMFFTLFFGVLDLATGNLSYISGGHETAFIISASGEFKAELEPTGPLVGIDANSNFQIAQATLEPGDLILIYSDGVIDARDPAGKRFTLDRLRTLLNRPRTSAAAVVEDLKSTLRGYISTADQFDDITILAVRRQMPS
jgi:sigma-B regulation protein RsbU (phosphoserine phosphatase)